MLELSSLRENILTALRKFISQRPGLEFGNYGDVTSYRAEVRSITQALNDARTLLRAIELSGIEAELLIDSFSAFSGRLSIDVTGNNVKLDYCTGQYFPTEYRRAVCAVCANALWNYYRNDYRENAGELLRKRFNRYFGKRIQQSYFR